MSLLRLTRRAGLLAAATSLTVLLAACGDDDAPEAAPTTDAPTPVAPWAPIVETDGDDVVGLDFSETPEPSGELEVATISEGDGPEVESGQLLTFDYYGSIYDGDGPFDESYNAEPIQYPIGVGQLIPGWDQAIPGTKVGSRILMMIPPELGYGDAPNGAIPAGSTLYFVIDVIDAQ